ncbi:uncharacterized protein LOC120388539 isoform X2 [Mauremys reevesii]|uniref:uncharacterized protein LOC120388539 isoform X2 n=1 Tax=Mauremys reevesii TaxID=260615 RepID=UPI00193F0FFC|nr:uncharacterized protein LOC120388539 isoform X2 [Mauremys reevesii]
MSVNVKLILIEILSDLSEEQFERFKWRLVNGVDDKKISYYNLEFANREKTIDEMLSHFGSSDALEKAREILDAVPRKDLADKLMKKVKDTLREILDELSEENFNKFKSCLVNGDDDKKISRPSLEGANREKTIGMVDHFGSFDALETAEKVLEDMKVAGKLMKKVPAKQAQERKKETLKEPTEEELKEPTEEKLKETTEMARVVEIMINNFSEVKGAFVRQRLTANLATLREDQFEKFKDVLCETPVKDLVRAGDEFLDAPNTFQRDASLETLAEDLIGKFGRTYALRAAATVMEKIERRDLAKELERELHEFEVTQHGLMRKPKGEVDPEDRFLLWISLRFSLHFILPPASFEGIPALERHSGKG